MSTLPPQLMRDSIGAALRFAVDNWRFVAVVAAAGAVGSTIFTLPTLNPANPGVGLLGLMMSGFVRAFAYAALLGAFLFGVQAVRARIVQDGWRVWSAMAVIGFFLFILFTVLSIPAMIIVASGPLAPYGDALQQAGSDQAQVMAVMTRFAQENPTTVLMLTLFFGTIWYGVTSRLYLAAPATVDQGRILTFETWRWTKGALFQIVGARLILLFPAFVLSFAFSMLVARLLGVAGGTASMGAAVVYMFASSFVSFAFVVALEAGLSSALYRALKPPAA